MKDKNHVKKKYSLCSKLHVIQTKKNCSKCHFIILKNY